MRRPGYVLRRHPEGRRRVYQQTFVDTYAKVGFAKLYDRKTPITAADLLNDRVIPFYEEHGGPEPLEVHNRDRPSSIRRPLADSFGQILR